MPQQAQVQWEGAMPRTSTPAAYYCQGHQPCSGLREPSQDDVRPVHQQSEDHIFCRQTGLHLGSFGLTNSQHSLHGTLTCTGAIIVEQPRASFHAVRWGSCSSSIEGTPVHRTTRHACMSRHGNTISGEDCHVSVSAVDLKGRRTSLQ